MSGQYDYLSGQNLGIGGHFDRPRNAFSREKIYLLYFWKILKQLNHKIFQQFLVTK